VLNNATAKYSLLQTAQLYAQLHTAVFDAQAATESKQRMHNTT
jgi:hypothetical protein